MSEKPQVLELAFISRWMRDQGSPAHRVGMLTALVEVQLRDRADREDALAAMHAVDGMATSPRWRLMLPEAVAEALYEDDPRNGPLSFASRAAPRR